METVVSSFAEQVRDHDADLVRTTRARAPDAIDDRLEPPVVGSGLGTVGLSLDDLETAVKTDPTPEDLYDAATGLTPAISAVADYGSVVLQGTVDGEEPMSLYPETNVVVVAESAITAHMADALETIAAEIREGNRSHVVATGPSATADMGDLVLGAHGPKAVTVVVVSDE
ncbi:MAG: LUD domain-containing protein [Halanaeroarchaeum sp.]